MLPVGVNRKQQDMHTQIIIADLEQHHYPREYDEYTLGEHRVRLNV
jgi:hypothetical protein